MILQYFYRISRAIKSIYLSDEKFVIKCYSHLQQPLFSGKSETNTLKLLPN